MSGNVLSYAVISVLIGIGIIVLTQTVGGAEHNAPVDPPQYNEIRSSPPSAERTTEAASVRPADQVTRDDTLTRLAWAETQTMEELRARLRDPRSAQFRNVGTRIREVRGRSVPVTCGSVNARNGLGGYNGFQQFIGFAGVLPTVMETDMAPSEFARVWRTLCS